MKFIAIVAKVLTIATVGLICIGIIRVAIEKKTNLLSGSLHLPR